MAGISCEFYADEEDLEKLLIQFHTLGHLKFIQMKSDLNGFNRIFTEAIDVLPHAKVSPERPTRRQSFLVMEADQDMLAREIVLKDGSGTIRVADQNQNWDSVVIAFGGNAGDQTLIMSDINTVGDTEKARSLHRKVRKLVSSVTLSVRSKGTTYRLMPGAIQKAKAGWRLARDKGWLPCTDAAISFEDIARLEATQRRVGSGSPNRDVSGDL